MPRRQFSVGDLCTVQSRGVVVCGYEFYGAYAVRAKSDDKPDLEYETVKTTGEMLDRDARGEVDCRSFQMLSVKGRYLPDGTPVIVTHTPVYITNSRTRKQLKMGKHTQLCEVLHEGEMYWVKSGLLKAHRC